MKLTKRDADNLVADVIFMRLVAANPAETEASKAVYRRFVERVLTLVNSPSGGRYRCDPAATAMLAMIGGAE